MNLYSEIRQAYDISFKYSIMVLNKRLHQYLKLKDEYVISYPTEVITKDMRNLRMNGLYKTNRDILNNIEAQSTNVREKELRRFAKYRNFAEYTYNMPVNTVVILTNPQKNLIEEFEISETDILRPIYFYIPKRMIIKKFNNIINKVNNKEELNEDETLEIAFLPLFAPKELSKEITEKMCNILKINHDIKREFKRELSFILQIMIFKNFKDSKKREKLLEEINMKEFSSDLEVIAYDLYGEELEEKDEIINQKEEKLNEKDEIINQKEEKLNQTKEILTEIKEKNNLDKETLQKINQALEL